MLMIEVKDVVKKYPDGTLAVKGISFEVKPGEVFGLVGPNGAGKSTTIKMIATLLRPTSGDLKVAGVDVVKNPFEARKHIAYLPESVGGEKGMKVENFLKYLAGMYSINTGKSVDEMVMKALDVSCLGAVKDKKVGELSKGMFRRLMIGVTLMTDAPVIILDEPTSGVDVIESVRIREIVRDAAASDAAVLFSSHNMLEVESLCDRVGLLYGGRLLAIGGVDEVVGDSRNLEEVFMKLIKNVGGGVNGN